MLHGKQKPRKGREPKEQKMQMVKRFIGQIKKAT